MFTKVLMTQKFRHFLEALVLEVWRQNLNDRRIWWKKHLMREAGTVHTNEDIGVTGMLQLLS